jgi:flagellar hook-associated protein 1 FlgK
MSAFGTLSGATSALSASQIALTTSAHNLANVDTTGYVRQQIVFTDSNYLSIGSAAASTSSVGTGVDVSDIRQVRDEFLDASYREESSRYGFYSATSSAIDEIEVILGETEGESFADVMTDLWDSMNELSKDPSSLETRGTFIQSAAYFVERSNLIMEQFTEYQDDMNTQVSEMVDEINEIGNAIYDLNQVIVKTELSGVSANDYRDQRNLLLDELSQMVDISYNEDMYGNVTVKIEGVEFVTKTDVNEMGLDHEDMSTLVKPVWEHLDKDVFDLDEEISTAEDNDKGSLKGFLLSRGSSQADYTDMLDTTSYETNIEPSAIMNAQAQFDNLVNGIVTMINDMLCPNTGTPATLDTDNAPYGLDGSQGIELFVRDSVDRYDETTGYYNEPDTVNGVNLYSAGNISINPEILADYDKLCISSSYGEDSDNTIVEAMLTAWDEEFSSIEPGLTDELSFTDYYEEFISIIATAGSSSDTMVDNQESLVLSIDTSRESLTGVSSEEELSNVIRFQQAYNAAAQVITVVDEMLEDIINFI